MTSAMDNAIIPEDGAKTLILLASDEYLTNVTGKYYSEGVEEKSSDITYDEELQDFFFDKIVELIKCPTDVLKAISLNLCLKKGIV